MEVFIDQDGILWIEPGKGYVGKFIITVEATNVSGDQDSTTFNVEVVENDEETCNSKSEQCECQAKNTVFLDG